MKKCLFVLVAVFAITSVASAQVGPPVSLHVGGAVSLPNSPDAFADFYKTGFHGMVGVGYDLMPNLQAVGKIEYHRFALDIDADPILAAADVTGGGHNNLWMFGADGRYAFSVPASPVKPYVLGGLGFARMSISDLEGSDPLVASFNDVNPEPQTDFYFNLGVGVELKTGPMWSMFAQVRYVSVATEGESSAFIPITLGLKFF